MWDEKELENDRQQRVDFDLNYSSRIDDVSNSQSAGHRAGAELCGSCARCDPAGGQAGDHRHENDELIQYLDDILSGLKYEDGHYDLVKLKDANYQQKLDVQMNYWQGLKREIQAATSRPTSWR